MKGMLLLSVLLTAPLTLAQSGHMDFSAKDESHFDYCLMRNEFKKIFISAKQILSDLFI